MQKIFHNGNILTFNKEQPEAKAMLVNDESIVLAGENEEVLEMKMDDTEVIDLGGKVVIPAFYDTNARIYELIEQNLKNANKENFLENNVEIDENYEKFVNFDAYCEEFLKIQDEYIRKGIFTVCEMGVNNKEFIFWKKLSESGKLIIDVIAYIDIITSKDVMDNNCRSYRKYKNHFRVGGYLFKLDGKLSEKKAWLTKNYKSEGNYKGYSYLLDEQLCFLIKSALEEKKQVVAEVNGNAALEQFIRCFEKVTTDKEFDDFMRPIAKNCNFATSSQVNRMKKLKISPSFELNEIKYNGDSISKSLGFFRSKSVLPVKLFKGADCDFLINSSDLAVPDIFELLKIASDRKTAKGKILGKKHIITFAEALESMIKHSSYFIFDGENKGELISGFRADFLVLSGTFDEISAGNADPIEKRVISGVVK